MSRTKQTTDLTEISRRVCENLVSDVQSPIEHWTESRRCDLKAPLRRRAPVHPDPDTAQIPRSKAKGLGLCTPLAMVSEASPEIEPACRQTHRWAEGSPFPEPGEKFPYLGVSCCGSAVPFCWKAEPQQGRAYWKTKPDLWKAAGFSTRLAERPQTNPTRQDET